MAQIPQKIVKKLIEETDNDRQFEVFSNELISGIEGGAAVFPTSVTWDAGIDGRGHVGGQQLIIAASTTKQNWEDKLESDVKKIAARVKSPLRMYFCCTQSISGVAQQKMRLEMEKLLPKDSFIDVLGSIQISDWVSKNPKVFSEHYSSEIEQIRTFINAELTDEAVVKESLWLTMATFADNDTSAIKVSLYEGVLLQCLKSARRCTSKQAANIVSEHLKLPRSIEEGVIQYYLEPISKSF